jgi:uncharacterized coiled-coil protein SlyX
MSRNDAERVTDLELLFTHLERQIGELNAIVLRQQTKIEGLERELLRLAAREPPDDEDLATEE